MSHTYPGIDAFPTSITEPDDGDDVDAASVQPIAEGIADRTTYLKARLFTSNGAQILRNATSVANLRAISSVGLTSESICTVTGVGLFVWSTLSALSDDGIFVVNPTGHVGNGRWVNMASIENQPNGLATLDASSNLLASQRVGWVVGGDSMGSGSYLSNLGGSLIASATPVAIGGLIATVANCAVGDVVDFSASGFMINTDATTSTASTYVYVAIKEGAGPTVVPQVATGCPPMVGNNKFEPWSTSGRYVVTQAGTVSAQVYVLMNSAGYNLQVFSPANIRATVWRP